MYYSNYENDLKKEKEFLDTIELSQYIHVGRNAHNIMNEIFDDYNERYQKFRNSSVDLFDEMDDYQFTRYVETRYPKVYFYEVNEYKVGSA